MYVHRNGNFSPINDLFKKHINICFNTSHYKNTFFQISVEKNIIFELY